MPSPTLAPGHLVGMRSSGPRMDNQTDPAAERRSPGMVEVRVSAPGEARETLAGAVRLVREAADRFSTGIMITDVGEGCYVVRAHPAVPHGLVREQPRLEQAPSLK